MCFNFSSLHKNLQDMSRLLVEKSFKASVGEVWETIKAFKHPEHFMPFVESSETEGDGVGMRRTMKFRDGSHAIEKLHKIDENERYILYKLIYSPLPVNEYMARVKLRHDGEGTVQVTWESRFNILPDNSSEEIENQLKATYNLSIEGLERLHSGSMLSA